MKLKVLTAFVLSSSLLMGSLLTIVPNTKQKTREAEVKPDVKAESKEVKKVKEEPKGTIPTYLQDISVTIHAGTSQGSGVIKNRDGVSYVLTAAHVVSRLRRTRPIIDPKTGSTRVKIEFDDAKIVKEIYDDEHRSVGRIEMDAEVLRYSDADNGEDLALLRLRKKNLGVKTPSAKFFTEKEAVPVGTELWHVGSLLGQQGSNSLTPGAVSQHGRVIKGNVYDQSTCAAFPGSSGGGVYRKEDGQYVGMIVRGAGETFNLYVPMRRINKWAKRVGVDFVLDDKIAVPSNEELRKVPIEEVGGEDPTRERATHKSYNSNEPYPFLIQTFPKKGKISIEW